MQEKTGYRKKLTYTATIAWSINKKSERMYHERNDMHTCKIEFVKHEENNGADLQVHGI